MIARIFIILLLLIILPDVYIDRHLLRRNTRYLWWQRVLFWLPGLAMTAFTIILTLEKNFAPQSTAVLNLYLFLLGIYVLPKFVFVVCSVLGWGHCRFHHTKNNWGNPVGLFLASVMTLMVAYGSTFGFRKVVVRHEDYYSADLPKAFDGYRIVHLSDAHVGTYSGRYAKILNTVVDSIVAQKADAIVFTGDIQNMEPKELYSVLPELKRIGMKDKGTGAFSGFKTEWSGEAYGMSSDKADIKPKLQGTIPVFSVLGNHDYAMYIKATPEVKASMEHELISIEKSLGWRLLINEHSIIRRGGDSIVIAGMENDGRSPFPSKGDIRKTLAGIGSNAFVVMLEHDPTSWRRTILPGSNAQLTLSGHTHAMQFSIFGWSPASLIYKEWGGMYHEGSRAINVSIGMGGFIPFRFGASNEIVVITLHRR